jgi:hypothetical protein
MGITHLIDRKIIQMIHTEYVFVSSSCKLTSVNFLFGNLDKPTFKHVISMPIG